MTSTRGARFLKVLMGLALIAMGTGATLWLWGSWTRAKETRAWTPSPAIVLSSQVLTDRPSVHSPLRYSADVRYRYTYQGKTFPSSRIKRVDGSSAHKDVAEALAAKYWPGQSVTCYVNPAQPTFAILELPSRAAVFSIWFPLLFVVGGVGMVVSALRNVSRAVAIPSSR
jgi:hypothetical protein